MRHASQTCADDNQAYALFDPYGGGDVEILESDEEVEEIDLLGSSELPDGHLLVDNVTGAVEGDVEILEAAEEAEGTGLLDSSESLEGHQLVDSATGAVEDDVEFLEAAEEAEGIGLLDSSESLEGHRLVDSATGAVEDDVEFFEVAEEVEGVEFLGSSELLDEHLLVECVTGEEEVLGNAEEAEEDDLLDASDVLADCEAGHVEFTAAGEVEEVGEIDLLEGSETLDGHLPVDSAAGKEDDPTLEEEEEEVDLVDASAAELDEQNSGGGEGCSSESPDHKALDCISIPSASEPGEDNIFDVHVEDVVGEPSKVREMEVDLEASSDDDDEARWLQGLPEEDTLVSSNAEVAAAFLDGLTGDAEDSDMAHPQYMPLLSQYLIGHPQSLVSRRRKRPGKGAGKRYFGGEERSEDVMADKVVTGCWACGKLDHESSQCVFKRCFHCSQQGHEQMECVQKSLRCSRCYRPGHIKEECPEEEYRTGCQNDEDLYFCRCVSCGQEGHVQCHALPGPSSSSSARNLGLTSVSRGGGMMGRRARVVAPPHWNGGGAHLQDNSAAMMQGMWQPISAQNADPSWPSSTWPGVPHAGSRPVPVRPSSSLSWKPPEPPGPPPPLPKRRGRWRQANGNYQEEATEEAQEVDSETESAGGAVAAPSPGYAGVWGNQGVAYQQNGPQIAFSAAGMPQMWGASGSWHTAGGCGGGFAGNGAWAAAAAAAGWGWAAPNLDESRGKRHRHK